MSENNNEIHPLTRLSPGQDGPVIMSGPLIPPADEAKSGLSISGTLRRRWLLIVCTWVLLAGGATAFIWHHFGTEYEAVGFIRMAPYIRPVLNADEGSGILPFYNAFVWARCRASPILACSSGPWSRPRSRICRG